MPRISMAKKMTVVETLNADIHNLDVDTERKISEARALLTEARNNNDLRREKERVLSNVASQLQIDIPDEMATPTAPHIPELN